MSAKKPVSPVSDVVTWGESDHGHDDLIDQCMMSVEYGPSGPVGDIQNRWHITATCQPYERGYVVHRDSYLRDPKAMTHCVKLAVRIHNVNGYPLARWYVLAIADRKHDSRYSTVNVEAPGLEALRERVQAFADEEYGTEGFTIQDLFVPSNN